MAHREVGVGLLVAVTKVEPVERCFGALAVENDLDVGAGERPAEGDGLRGVAAVRCELHLAHREVVGGEIFFLNDHVMEDGFSPITISVTGQLSEAAVTNMLFDHRGPAAGFGDDQDARRAQSCSSPRTRKRR